MQFKDIPSYSDRLRLRQGTVVSENGESLLVSTIEVPEPSEYGGFRYESAILLCDEQGFVPSFPDTRKDILHYIRTNDEFAAKLYHIANKHNAADLIRG